MQNTFAPTLPRIQTLILFGVGVCMLLGLSLTIAAYMLLPINPNGDELILMIVSWGSSAFILTMNFCLCTLFAACIFASIVYNMGKGLTINHTVLELTNGEKTQQLNAVAISPDVLIVSQTNAETKRDLLEKFNQAKNNQVDGVWIVCIAYQDVCGLLLTDTGESYAFDRNTPPFQADETETPIAAHDYKAETWAEYQAYLNEFCFHFTRWSPREKLIAPTGKSAEKKINVLWSLSVLFVLFAFPLSAQKSVRLMEYLGQARANVRPIGHVKFVFEDAPIKRTADGSKTYAELLKAGPFFNDADNAGRLIAIQVVNGGQIKTVYPDKNETPQTASASVIPTQSALPAPGELQMDDSLQTAIAIEAWKEKIDKSTKKIWGQSLQWWKLAIYVLGNFFHVLMGLLGISILVAKTATKESVINACGTSIYGGYLHNIAAGAILWTYIFSILIAIIMLINIYILALTGDFASIVSIFISWQFGGVILWFALIAIVRKIVNKVVPDPQVINAPPHRPYAAPNQYKGLNQ
jgi:hypothetical protein